MVQVRVRGPDASVGTEFSSDGFESEKYGQTYSTNGQTLGLLTKTSSLLSASENFPALEV